MPQIFRPRANSIARVVLLGALLLLTALGVIAYEVQNSSYVTRAEIVIEQPIPFSHEHHVKGLGIDCRYCHTSVTQSAFAGIPPTKTCITCHSQIWTNAPMLEPVRASWNNDTPIRWNRVHDLPDFVYFNHSVHVHAGVECAECHGDVSSMPLVAKVQSFSMGFCLDCHRNPEARVPKYRLRTRRVTSTDDLLASAGARVEDNPLLTCSACHR